jgi:hypothetical protein
VRVDAKKIFAAASQLRYEYTAAVANFEEPVEAGFSEALANQAKSFSLNPSRDRKVIPIGMIGFASVRQ